MKTYILPSLKMTLVMLVLCCIFYFGIVSLIGKLAPGGGGGKTLITGGRMVGYENIGQKFTDDKWFWGRPSAVNYNAAGSGGSNKATSNPDYLTSVQERINTFLIHNPGVIQEQIPVEMVTASGSGLDPNITPAGAYIQIARVAKARGLNESKVRTLVEQYIESNPIGPDKVNVLKLNIALDQLR